MKKIIIDGEGAIFGRLCVFAAKKALEGNEVAIVNSEKILITGNRQDILEKYRRLRDMGKGSASSKRPKYPRVSYQIVKRGIRGMLPDFRRGIGKQALARIRCYEGVPKEFENDKMIKAGKEKPKKFVELKDIAKNI